MEKYLIVLVLLIAASFVYLKLAVKYKIIDKPNERSSHKKATVRGGGILFTIAVLLFFVFNDFQYPYFLAGVLIIAVVSFIDDNVSLSSKIRFPFQVLAVFLVLYQLSFPVQPFYLSIFAIIAGLGALNMFNFMDGVNGITGLYSLAVLFGFYLINTNEQLVNSDLITFEVLSILVFGFYNFRKKALFFAGDIGSITIGMIVFFLWLLFTLKLASPLMMLLVVVYGADSFLTFLYRKLFTKESVFEPHRHHIYQKIVDNTKISHLSVSIIYTIIQLLVSFLVYKTYQLEIETQFFIFAALISFFIICYILLFRKLKNQIVD
jgi:UDP-GlcNAc:undecaprenyl-phosphate GlcNAc-1-phosphate transferase